MTETQWCVDRAVLPDAVLTGARIVARDGRIVAVDHGPAGPGAVRLQGTLLPGCIDLQVNGAGGRSVDEATPGALDTVSRAVAAGGATAFLPTLITAPWDRLLHQVADVARWIRAGAAPGAEPLGIHVEGPFLTAPGAHDPAWFVDPTPARLDALLDAAAGTLRLVTLANARPGAAAAVAHLRRRGVAVSLGHCDRPDGFAACVDAGASAVTHLFNVMGPLHHRDVGLAQLALDDERLLCPLICDGVHVHPLMLRLAFRVLGPDRLALVTDAVGAAGMPDGAFALAGQPVVAKDGVVRDAKGHLAGSALTMSLAVRNFLAAVPAAGEWTIGRIAAANPARLLGQLGERGAIAPGARAVFSLWSPAGTLTTIH